MRTLILDQYSNQPVLTRWIGNSLTGLGWIFWIFLWLPLIATASVVLEFNTELPLKPESSHSLLSLLTTMLSHLVMVLSLIGIFIVWASLQCTGKSLRARSIQGSQNPFAINMSSFEMSQEKMANIRKARVTVVMHESNGRIHQVDVLNIPGMTDFSPAPMPQAA